MSAAETLTAHFDAIFGADADPWRTRTSWYERRKRALTLAMLPRERFRRAFEPGCGGGVTTIALAARCDELVATDASSMAVARARQRIASMPGVRLQQGRLPDDWPEGRFDLIVIGELGYYLDAAALARVAARCRAALAADGCLVACHWRRGADDMPLSADTVHAALGAACVGARLGHYEDDDLLLDAWCVDGRSVAQREGLA